MRAETSVINTDGDIQLSTIGSVHSGGVIELKSGDLSSIVPIFPKWKKGKAEFVSAMSSGLFMYAGGMPQNFKTESFNIANLLNPVPASAYYAAAPECWLEGLCRTIIDDSYHPQIALASNVLGGINPAWSTCVNPPTGNYDPPVAYRTTASIAAPTLRDFGPSENSPAAASEVLPPGNPADPGSNNPKPPSYVDPDDSPGHKPIALPGSRPTILPGSSPKISWPSATGLSEGNGANPQVPSPGVNRLPSASTANRHIFSLGAGNLMVDGTRVEIPAGSKLTLGSRIITPLASNGDITAMDLGGGLTLENGQETTVDAGVLPSSTPSPVKGKKNHSHPVLVPFKLVLATSFFTILLL
jgi:hypothetical protein